MSLPRWLNVPRMWNYYRRVITCWQRSLVLKLVGGIKEYKNIYDRSRCVCCRPKSCKYVILNFSLPSYLQIIGSGTSTSALQDSSSSLYSLLNLEEKSMELLHASSLLNCRANQRLLLQALEQVCTTGIAGVGVVLLG